jgi:hypothetical protein
MPSARSGRPIASVDTSAVSKGVIQFGKGIQNLGEAGLAYAKHQEATDDYDTELKFRQFQFDQERDLDDQMQSVAPDKAVTFGDDWRSGYQQRAGQFLEGVPQSLRGKYQVKVQESERQLYRPAAVFARTEQKRQSVAKLDDLIDGYVAKSGNIDRGREEFGTMVDQNPWLSPVEKEEVRRKGLRRLEDLHVKGLVERASDPKNPDFRSLRTLDRDLGAGPSPQSQIDTQANPEARAQPFSRATAEAVRQPAQPISFRLETGQTDPMKGIVNISHDSNGSRSYGNFGLNSQGSAQEFVRDYGAALGLSGEPGTAEFDRSWKEVARADPEGLHQAEMDWYGKTVLPRVTVDLVHAGVSDPVATDPRVQAYFADRLVQYGPASIGNHETRVASAFAAAGGDVEKFLRGMTEADRNNLRTDFRSALRSGVYSQKGHDTRTYGRLNLAMAGEGGAVLPGKSESYAGPYKNLTGEDRLQLQHLVRTKLAEAEKTAVEQERARAIWSGAMPVDPDAKLDREIIDKAVGATDLSGRLTAADPHAAGELTLLVKNTGYVPEAATSALRATSVNGTPEQRQFALETASNLMREKPGALEGSEKSRALRDDAQLYEVLTMDAGVDAPEALQRIAELRTPEFAKRKEALKKELAEGGVTSPIAQLQPSDISGAYDTFWTSEPELGGSQRQSALLFNTYRDLVKDHYVRTGDIDVAKSMAIKDLKRTYDVSSITGNRRLMRYPPEKFYQPIEPAPGKTPDLSYFSNQLRDSVNEYVNGAGKMFGDVNPEAGAAAMTVAEQSRKEIPLSDIYIETIPQTVADVRAGRSNPGYAVVWFEEEDGIRVLKTAPGAIFRADVKGAMERRRAGRELIAREIQQRDIARETAREAAPLRPVGKAAGEVLRGERSLPTDTGAAERLRGGNRAFFRDRQLTEETE